ncbi:MAG TPA: 3-oxoadipate enol-lactonase [Thermoleophilaceae bacterium]|nr:3-oxoadipate enol-lactonase [Thermoleophilaceae bacterium]
MSVDLHHMINGPEDAPVVVLSNSLGANLEMWAPQVPPLSVPFRVLRYDQRGHGQSPIPPGPYDIPDLGRDVLDLLDRLEIEQAHFCGLSLGGMTGMWLAANAPERIERLVLACTTSHYGDPELWQARIEAVREGGTESIAEAGIERWFTRGFREREPATAERFRQMIAATDDEGYIECCAAVDRLDERADLPKIEAPTLIIAGAEDTAAPPDPHSMLLAAEIPGARLEVLDDAAHLANVEQPETVTNLILEHLEHA